MKTTEIKQQKGKVNGVTSTLVNEKNVDKALGNILFVLGFKQAKGFYYKEGDINIVDAAKNYIKGGKYVGGEPENVDFIDISYSQIDAIDDVDELNKLLNHSSANH